MAVCSRVGKSSSGRGGGSSRDEIQALLAKLKALVPNMPRHRRLSKLEIIQHVIDYIVDLQIALDTSHPAPNNSPPRQPLGVIDTPANSCAAQEIIQIDKIPPARPEVSRTVSC